MKGVIQPNHIAVNKYLLIIAGLPPLTPVKVSGIDNVLESVELPDRTQASGGNTKPTEFTITLPSHHTIEVAAMEKWLRDGQDPVDPNYKKNGVLIMQRIGAGVPRQFQLQGMFTTGRKMPDLDMHNEGEMSAEEWKIKLDQLDPLT